jgi:hypothetical protein
MARQLLIIFLILSSEPVYAKWVSVSANNPGETMYAILAPFVARETW